MTVISVQNNRLSVRTLFVMKREIKVLLDFAIVIQTINGIASQRTGQYHGKCRGGILTFFHIILLIFFGPYSLLLLLLQCNNVGKYLQQTT